MTCAPGCMIEPSEISSIGLPAAASSM